MTKKKAQKSIGSSSQHVESDEPSINEYERLRKQRIVDNRARMETLSINKKTQLVIGQVQTCNQNSKTFPKKVTMGVPNTQGSDGDDTVTMGVPNTQGSDGDDTEVSTSDDNYDKGDLEDQEMSSVKQATKKRKKTVTQTEENQIVINTQEKQVVTQTSKKAKKGRGPNKGMRVSEPMHLEYNKNGQPCGKFKKHYAKHLGLCVRKLNILQDFDNVPKGLKKTLWEDTVNLFHIDPTDEAKKKVFDSGLNRRFRDFKAKLISGWISLTRDRTKTKKPLPKDEPRKVPDTMPYQIYSNISEKDWATFVAMNTTLPRVEQREKNSKNAKQREFWHHMGPKTFDDWRPTWIKDGIYPNVSSTTTAGSSTSFAIMDSDRTSDFACSHYVKDSNGKWVIPDPKAKTVIESLMEWKKKEAIGEFKRMGDKDEMFMVLGKDHDGRVRGQGGVRVGKKKVFGDEFVASRGKSTSNTSLVDIEALTAKIQADVEKKMMIRLNSMLEPFGVKMDVEENVQLPNDLSSHPTTPHVLEARTPQLWEVQLPFPFPNVTEETPCDLLHPNDCADLVVVAYGHAQPRKENEIVHFKKVDHSNWRVSVDTVIRDYENVSLPFPKPEVDINTLLQAQFSFIEWPCGWIRFSNKELEKNFPNTNKSANRGKENEDKENVDKEKVNSQPKSGGNELRLSSKDSNSKLMSLVKPPNATPLVNEQVLKSLTKSCYWLHNCFSNLPDDAPLEVQLDKTQFHYQENGTTFVYKQDVCEFLSRDMLCLSILQVFMSALNEDLKGCASVSKVGWLCPQEIRADHCLDNSVEVKEYIERGMIECTRTGDNFIIVPYLEELHWCLLVLSPSNHTIYLFDSARGDKPRSLLIKCLLNSEMVKLRGKIVIGKPTLPTWKTIRCAQQPNGVDCGLYVMKFMSDIVSSCTCATDLDKVFNTQRDEPFTDAEINEVRDKFASYVTDHCVFS